MRKIDDAPDLNGRPLLRGDTVTTVGGGTTGKIKDIVSDEGALFVEVRPMYQSAGKGVWHASDRLLWLSRPNVKPTEPAKPGSDPRKTARVQVKATAKSSGRKK
jgi:hypothetical protein